jgi:hypothetical protein
MAAAEQFTGELTISPMEKRGAGRPLLVAYLKDPEDRYGRGILFPLFDVRVIKLTPSGMHLAGYQIESMPVDGPEGTPLTQSSTPRAGGPILDGNQAATRMNTGCTRWPMMAHCGRHNPSTCLTRSMLKVEDQLRLVAVAGGIVDLHFVHQRQ